MAEDYCQIVRDEFQLLDKRNPDQLSNFFIRYRFFSTDDLAQVLSVSGRYIRKMKNRTDIKRTTYKRQITKTIKTLPDIKLEPGWDCAEWWRHYYRIYGVRMLSKITHFSIPTVWRKLHKHNIPIHPKGKRLSANPCCNYEWLNEHYVEKHWTIPNCAKAAGVSNDSITTWLNRFKIQVRTRNAPKVGLPWDSTAVGETPCVTVGSE
jgi:hypothetical protein